MPIDNPGVQSPRTIWTPAGGGTESYLHDIYLTYRTDAVGETASVVFDVPGDFNSIYSAVLIVFALATQVAADWDLESDYCGDGQAANEHSETDTATTYDVLNGKKQAIDLSGILTNLSAGDTVSIKFTQSTAGHNAAVVGVRFSYN